MSNITKQLFGLAGELLSLRIMQVICNALRTRLTLPASSSRICQFPDHRGFEPRAAKAEAGGREGDCQQTAGARGSGGGGASGQNCTHNADG